MTVTPTTKKRFDVFPDDDRPPEPKRTNRCDRWIAYWLFREWYSAVLVPTWRRWIHL